MRTMGIMGIMGIMECMGWFYPPAHLTNGFAFVVCVLSSAIQRVVYSCGHVCACGVCLLLCKVTKKFRIRRQKQVKNSPSKEVARLLQRSLQITLQNFVNFTRVVARKDVSVGASGLQCCIFLIFAFAISTFSLIFAQRYITLPTA